jgi:hypothetical protein
VCLGKFHRLFHQGNHPIDITLITQVVGINLWFLEWIFGAQTIVPLETGAAGREQNGTLSIGLVVILFEKLASSSANPVLVA